MKKIVFFLLCAASMANAQKKGSFSLHFDNFVGAEPLALKTARYTNAAGNEFSVSLFQYYISNISLIKKDGSIYTLPQDQSYFLIRENNEATKTITLTDIPKGKYKGISFTIGIDSARSASDISQRKGCLDVAGEARDMYWAWNSGYIFVKMEGTSPQSTGKNNIFMYHIGLFGGIGDKKTLNNIKQTTLSFGGEELRIKGGATPLAIFIKADALKLMNGPNNVDMAKNATVMGGPYSATIANNYQTMFSFGGLKPVPVAVADQSVTTGTK